LTHSKLSRLCGTARFDKQNISAVALHRHTYDSKEGLRFVPRFARKHPILGLGENVPMRCSLEQICRDEDLHLPSRNVHEAVL
jgi:hypothetical protein